MKYVIVPVERTFVETTNVALTVADDANIATLKKELSSAIKIDDGNVSIEGYDCAFTYTTMNATSNLTPLTNNVVFADAVYYYAVDWFKDREHCGRIILRTILNIDNYDSVSNMVDDLIAIKQIDPSIQNNIMSIVSITEDEYMKEYERIMKENSEAELSENSDAVSAEEADTAEEVVSEAEVVEE